MEREANYTAVGAFVLLVTVMAGLFVYWYSEGRDRRNYTSYEIYFQGSVSGLSEGGPVRYLGVDVGRVHRIRLDTRSPERVQVIADIDQSAPISEQTTAQLSLQGITGLLFIDLRQNGDQSKVMAAVPSQQFPVIKTVKSDFDTFLSSLPDIAGRAADLLERAQQIFSPANSAAISATLANFDKASSGLPATMKQMDGLIAELRKASTNVGDLSSLLSSAAIELGPDIGKIVSQMNTMTNNLARATARLDQMLVENQQGIATFTQDAVPELERTLREAKAAAEQLNELTRTLSENPSQLLYQPKSRGVEVPR
jgi:phospholipid/cholesterol/gamma-HCH transport system substrate-binding protein